MIRYNTFRKKVKFARTKPFGPPFEDKIIEIIRRRENIQGNNWEEFQRIKAGRGVKVTAREDDLPPLGSLLSDDEDVESASEDEQEGNVGEVLAQGGGNEEEEDDDEGENEENEEDNDGDEGNDELDEGNNGETSEVCLAVEIVPV